MAHREFLDQTGVQWEVWLTVPTKPERRHTPPGGVSAAVDRRNRKEFRVPLEQRWVNGWLTFRCPAETRRLAPFPRQWSSLSDAQLLVLCELAKVAKRQAADDDPRDSRA